MKKNGFTLVEIMIVVATLCLIAAISFPLISRSRENASEGRIQAELKSLQNAIIMYYSSTGRFPRSLNELTGYITITDIENKYELNPDLR